LPFELQIKFPGSPFMAYGLFEEHEQAYDAMKRHFDFLNRAQKEFVTMKEFSLHIVNVDVYQVIMTDHRKQFNASGLFLVFKIVDRPAEKLSVEELNKLGLGGVRYRYGPRTAKNSEEL
jgi:hypothetical protein